MSYRSWTCRSSLVHSFPHSSTHSFCFVSRVRKYFCFTNVLPGSSSSPSVENLKRKCEYKFKKKNKKNSKNIYYELKINKREKKTENRVQMQTFVLVRPPGRPSNQLNYLRLSSIELSVTLFFETRVNLKVWIF